MAPFRARGAGPFGAVISSACSHAQTFRITDFDRQNSSGLQDTNMEEHDGCNSPVERLFPSYWLLRI